MERLRRAERRKTYKPGGFNRSVLRHRRYDEAAKRADNELLTHQIIEPSPAFSPSNPVFELGVEESIVFEPPRMKKATTSQGRKDDFTKRSADMINSLLENPPQDFPKTKSDRRFIRRNHERISRFIKTLRNKGRLHPGVESIIKG